MPAFLSDSIVRGLSGDFQKTPLSQTSAVGATPPLDRALGKDGCPCFADLHHHDLRPGEPPEGQLDGGEGNEGDQGFGKVLEVFGT
jgi:hypothetical protein